MVSSWSDFRSQLSAWRTGTQNRSKGLVSPLDQSTELLAHPLPMETLEDTTGWQLFGFDVSFLRGGFSIVNYIAAAAGFSLREDGGICLRDDGGAELEESYDGH